MLILPIQAPTRCLHYCGMMHNPNETLVASYPKITVTISNPDGTVIATDSQTGGTIMPGGYSHAGSMMSVPLGGSQMKLLFPFIQAGTAFTSVNLKQVPRDNRL